MFLFLTNVLAKQYLRDFCHRSEMLMLVLLSSFITRKVLKEKNILLLF